VNENFIKTCFTETRTKEFREKLVDFIKEIHSGFLLQRNQESLIERLENVKVWHCDFDLNSPSLEIPQRKLLEKPICSREIQTVGDFLKSCGEGAIRNKGLLGIMKEVAAKSPEAGLSNAKKMGISEQLLAKVHIILFFP
jgi:hypothetical protein